MISREPPPVRAGPRRRGLIVLGVVVLVFFLTARGLASFWTDFLWFDSVQLTSVWSTLFFSKVALAVLAIIAAFGIIWAGDLNFVAPIITMFFLNTYAMTNLVAGIENLVGNPSFRPRF
ncbi:MAG: hypothetical protein ACE5MI_12475, partial [Acidimicrobiia bacterium]